MTRPTKIERAGQIGVSMPTINSWERCGVDIWDDDQVRAKIARSRNIPPTLKPEFMPTVDQSPAVGDDPAEVDIDALAQRLAATQDKHQAQTIKTQIDGLLNAYKLRAAAGMYVPKASVEDAMVRIAAAVKAAILRMEADLPPMLDGANPATMQRIIRDKVDEVMMTLSTASAEVWKVCNSEEQEQ